MKIARGWQDYEIIATGNGEKLERWKDIVLIRPDPQVIWKPERDLRKICEPDGVYIRSETGGGRWEYKRQLPDEWVVGWRELRFAVKPMGFKHTGLFPEQAVNWEIMARLIEGAGREINVLNLFAYTGGATVACLAAGASVTHVDSAKNMVERCKRNVALSGLSDRPVRYIVDDCRKFIMREIRRGRKYDAVIMDPPSYGRGANGEIWKIEDNIYDFLLTVMEVVSDDALFILINSYTTGLQPAVLYDLLRLAAGGRKGSTESYEVCLPTDEGIVLPCGASGLYCGERNKA